MQINNEPNYDVYEDDILGYVNKVSNLFDFVKMNYLNFPTLKAITHYEDEDTESDDSSFSETESIVSDCDADSEPEPESSKPVKLKFRITRMPNSDSE
jgi:hypothetical protein